MDDLGLDDLVGGVNKQAKEAKKNKNAYPQLIKKLRSNHSSVEKVVLKNDPVAKTAQDVFKCLITNTHVHTVNLKNCKITVTAAESLAKALRENTTLTTLVLNCNIPSEGMGEIGKALEDNTTLTTFKVNNGTNKYWESYIEELLMNRLNENKTLVHLNIAPIRATNVRNALQKLPVRNRKLAQEKEEGAPEDDEWANLSYDEEDSYEYVYDPNWKLKEEPALYGE